MEKSKCQVAAEKNFFPSKNCFSPAQRTTLHLLFYTFLAYNEGGTLRQSTSHAGEPPPG